MKKLVKAAIPTVVHSDSATLESVALKSVLCTEELTRRPSRPPDYATENRALTTLNNALANTPRTILQTLADTILQVFQADSAGISLLTKDEKRFYWVAIAGAWKPHQGGGTPRDFGPCGDVLDCNAPLLFKRWERRYPYLSAATPLAEEGLLIPFHIGGKAVGTIWSIAHDDRRTFDAEDLRQLESLGRFAAAAYQMVELQRTDDSRRAALNLMEDAVESRQTTQKLNSELRASEDRFRDFADSIPQLAWIADAGSDGQVNWFNQRWFAYTGTTLEAMKGSGWKSVHHPDYVDRVALKFEQHVRAGLDWEDIFPMRGKDGQYRWFLSRMKVIRDGSGQVVRIFGTNTDITEQRDMTEKLRQNDADLVEANRHKDEFLALLAHELRGPLAPLSNMLEVIKRAGSNPDIVEQAAGTMGRQLDQMSRLVDDLLDASRISRGKLELRSSQVELASVIYQAVETWRPAMDAARHELTVTLPPQPVYLHADPLRLAQVFGNLLSNACKYSEPGGRVALTAARQGSDVVVTVKDTGIGIPPGMLHQIFEMFAQIDRSLERSRCGLGIGLTLVRQLVEMHGGSVEAASAGAGCGSEFIVRLPVMDAPPQSRVPTITAPDVIPGRRILVVDDNRDSADSLSTLLKFTGNETYVAYDGLEALNTAAVILETAVEIRV